MKYIHLCKHSNKYEQVNVEDIILNVHAILKIAYVTWTCENNLSDHNMELQFV